MPDTNRTTTLGALTFKQLLRKGFSSGYNCQEYHCVSLNKKIFDPIKVTGPEHFAKFLLWPEIESCNLWWFQSLVSNHGILLELITKTAENLSIVHAGVVPLLMLNFGECGLYSMFLASVDVGFLIFLNLFVTD